MTLSGGAAAAVSLAVLAGFAGPVQAAVMGELGERVGVVPALAVSALVTIVLAAVAVLVVSRSFAGITAALHEPPWLWVGGALSVFIVLAVTIAPPRIGTTATIAVIIGGNLVMAAVIDALGLLGAERIDLGWERLLGLALIVVGAAFTLVRD